MGEEEGEEAVLEELEIDEAFAFFRLCFGSRTLGSPEKVMVACGKRDEWGGSSLAGRLALVPFVG